MDNQEEDLDNYEKDLAAIFNKCDTMKNLLFPSIIFINETSRVVCEYGENSPLSTRNAGWGKTNSPPFPTTKSK